MNYRKITRQLWDRFIQPKYFLAICFVVFTLLLARDPFSQRTLIPNFEPYPDTFHYIVPVRSLISGQGFLISREKRGIPPQVTPLYSIVFPPFFLIKNDPRMFYFANVFLSWLSLFLFYFILKKISSNKWIIGVFLMLFTTNYYIYWYPQWAMAENLVLTIFLAGILLLLSKISLRNIFFSSLVGIGFTATKYACEPLSAVFVLLYSFKILLDKEIVAKTRLKKLVVFALLSLFFSFPFVIVYNINPLSYFEAIFNFSFAASKAGLSFSSKPAESPIFSTNFLYKHFPEYWYALKGGSVKFLWDYKPMLPKWLAIPSLVGLFIGLLSRKTKFLSFSLIFLLFAQTVFVSTFYAVDLRYIYTAIPTQILGLSFIFIFLEDRCRFKKCLIFLNVVLLVIASYYIYSNALRIKNQVVLNFKYAEVPWYYISVLRLNDYFSKFSSSQDKPVVISPMPPYFIDFYSNGNYRLLPLSDDQEFRKDREVVWGPGDYSDLHKLYRTYIKEGKQLYLATYGLGVEPFLHEAFDEVNQDFKLTLVDNGCYELCKIYKVELKK